MSGSMREWEDRVSSERNRITRLRVRAVFFMSSAVALGACGGGGGDSHPLVTSFSGQEDQALTGAIAPRGGWQISLASGPSHGTLTGPSANGTFTYTPAANFFGNDSFVVNAAKDGNAPTSTTLTLGIQAQNDSPVANDDSAQTTPGHAVAVPVLANDSDVDDQNLTPRVVSAANGSATANADGTVTFAPASGFAGTTTFEYSAVDAAGAVSPAVDVTVEVQPRQKIVYFTTAAEPQLVYDDLTSVRSIGQALDANNGLRELRVSENGRSVFWRAGQIALSIWFWSDLTETTLDKLSVGVSSESVPGLVTSPDGVQILFANPEIIVVGGFTYGSNRAHYSHLIEGFGSELHDAPVVEQVNDFQFSPDSSAIIYRTNAPARLTTDVEVHRFEVGTGTRTTLLGPFTEPEAISSFEPLPNNEEALYLFRDQLAQRFYRTSIVTAAGSHPIGPTLGPLPTTIVRSHDISPDGSKLVVAAEVGPSPSNTTTVYLIDLQSGAYETIGQGFPIGSYVTPVRFSPDSTHVLLQVNSSGTTALYEAAVASPANVAQISPTLTNVSVFDVAYASGGRRVVYLANAAAADRPELYVVEVSQPQIAHKLNADVGLPILDFALSSDGTTVAYAQSETAGGTYSLWMVDATTPGLPKRVTSNLLTQQPPSVKPFAFVP